MGKVPKLKLQVLKVRNNSDYPIQISEWNKTAHRSL